MICIETYSDNPSFNLAVEEILLKNSDKDYFLVYVNSPSVIIGKNQVANKEANSAFLAYGDIPLYRRLTGGGTVFHDHGNINFSFIFNNARSRQLNFEIHTNILIAFLHSIGVVAMRYGKNDIRINGQKISGNAEYVFRDRVIRHGTLLFDTDTELLKSCMRTDQSAYLSRTVASNPAEVVNIRSLINGSVNPNQFKNDLLGFVVDWEGNKVTSLGEEYHEEALFLAQSKYRTWEWNYGYGSRYRVEKQFIYNGKTVNCRLSVKSGLIEECSLNGMDGADEVEVRLVGKRHFYPDIYRLFENDKDYHKLTDNLF